MAPRSFKEACFQAYILEMQVQGWIHNLELNPSQDDYLLRRAIYFATMQSTKDVDSTNFKVMQGKRGRNTQRQTFCFFTRLRLLYFREQFSSTVVTVFVDDMGVPLCLRS